MAEIIFVTVPKMKFSHLVDIWVGGVGNIDELPVPRVGKKVPIGLPPLLCFGGFLGWNWAEMESDRITQSRIKTHCSNYLWTELHHKFYNTVPDQLHLLPSILSPQISYPLISLCRSLPQNRLPPWIFLPALKRKLCLPLFEENDKPFCPCGQCNGPLGDHIF